jgi:hypothetical protein
MSAIQAADVPTLNQNTTGYSGSVVNALTIGTGLSGTSYNGSTAVTIANTGVTSAVAGTGISVSGATGAVTISNTGVTSVTGTSPVASSGGATPAISLATGYGDTQNPYASKTANYVLAAPNGSAGVPTFRAIVAADIPTLNQNTTGTASNVTGTVAIANGGTGATTLASASIVTYTGSETLTNKTLTNPTVTNYVESVVAIGTVTSSNTIALTNGTVQTATLTASTACTFTMPTATAGKSFVLLLKQAASTGNGTATFTGVKWGTAGAPTITATAGKMDILTFVSDGTNWYGSAAQGYTP